MSNKIEIPKANKGKGYVGAWIDGRIGWFLPTHLSGSKRSSDSPNERIGQIVKLSSTKRTERVFLCEITVKPLKDKKGRPITKIVKK